MDAIMERWHELEGEMWPDQAGDVTNAAASWRSDLYSVDGL